MTASVERDGAPPLLELRNVDKLFGHVQALDSVEFSLDTDEVVALVGDNGAGKSTLIKILSGVYTPTSGEIRVKGRVVDNYSPMRAAEDGISTVHQDLALIDSRSVAANLFLGNEFTKWGFVQQSRIEKEAAQTLREMDVRVPSVKVPMYLLSGGQRQAVAIARAVVQGGEAIIMDEPTAALGVAETHRVLRLIEELRAKGRSVLVISHNLQEVWQVADRVVVLHKGRVVGNRLKSASTIDEIVRLIMVGDYDDRSDAVGENV